jgi:hypothetical protein
MYSSRSHICSLVEAWQMWRGDGALLSQAACVAHAPPRIAFSMSRASPGLEPSEGAALLCRSGVAHVMDTCRAELQLVSAFFQEPLHPSAQSGLVEAVCNVLYDAMRPQYIQLQSLDELVDIIDVLQKAAAGEVGNQSGLDASMTLLEGAVSRVKEDVQERLIFRAAVCCC